jgi:hypothetical protein
MRKLYFYLPLLICLIFVAKSVLAQEIGVDLSKVGIWIGEFLGIPSQLMVTSKIFRYVMLPFLAVFVAVLGIMRDIMLFRRSRNLDWILALIISFIILPWSGVMGWLILWLYGTSGILSVTAVGLLIGIGAIMWFLGGIRRIHFNEVKLTGDMIKHLDDLRKKRETMYLSWAQELNAGHFDKADRLKNQIAALDAQISEREKRL